MEHSDLLGESLDYEDLEEDVHATPTGEVGEIVPTTTSDLANNNNFYDDDRHDASSANNNNILDEEVAAGVDPGDAALGSFLKDTHVNEEEHSLHSTSGTEYLDQLSDLIADHDGPELNTAVAKLINTHLSRNFNRQTTKNFEDKNSHASLVMGKLKNYPVPANTPELKACKVNDGVFKAMRAPEKKLNGDLHLVEAAICKSINAQGLAMQKVLELQDSIKKTDLGAKFNEVFKLLADSVEFQCFGRSKVNEVRRDQILNQLNDSYKYLSSQSKPEKGLLFGPNLEADMRSVELANRLSKKLAPKSTNRPFLGQQRGRGRGFRSRNQQRGYHPYQRPQYHQNYSNQNLPDQSSHLQTSALPPPFQNKTPRGLVI